MGYLQEFGGNVSQGWKDLGGALSGANPMKKHQASQYGVDETAFRDTFDNDQMRAKFAGALIGVNNRENPTMSAPGNMQAATIATGPQDQSRGMQMNLARALQAQAAGKGPSLADQQMRFATDRGMAQAQSLANSGTGLSAGQRARMARMGMADARMSANQNAVQGRLAEQMSAQQQLGSALAGMRGQDIGLATNQAGFQQGANQTNYQGQLTAGQANLGAALQAQGQRDQMTQFYQGGQMALNQADQQRLMELERLKQQGHMGIQGINAQGHANQQNAVLGFLGGTGQALATWDSKKPA